MSMKQIFLLSILLLCYTSLLAQDQNIAARLVQEQLDAYNQRDIEAFLEPYSDSVKIFNHPDQLLYEGKEGMRKRYGPRFESNPDLHCTLMNRMVLDNMVIDQESVIVKKGNPPVQVFAMYKIAGNKIVEVYFIRPKIDHP